MLLEPSLEEGKSKCKKKDKNAVLSSDQKKKNNNS
jgi:hypothetical protein